MGEGVGADAHKHAAESHERATHEFVEGFRAVFLQLTETANHAIDVGEVVTQTAIEASREGTALVANTLQNVGKYCSGQNACQPVLLTISLLGLIATRGAAAAVAVTALGALPNIVGSFQARRIALSEQRMREDNHRAQQEQSRIVQEQNHATAQTAAETAAIAAHVQWMIGRAQTFLRHGPAVPEQRGTLHPRDKLPQAGTRPSSLKLGVVCNV